jgi:general secretion pathway protein G
MVKTRQAGFTLLELMVVITILGVLVAVALPSYRNAVVQAREAVLRQDLFVFRDLIDQYQADRGRYPESLETLVEAGYLRKIPVDPITQRADWVVVEAEPDPANPGEVTGIFDVRSAAQGTSLGGTPYAEW